MNGTLTISSEEPGAPFRRFDVRFADGGQLHARGLTACKLDADSSAHGVLYVSANLGRNGVHTLTFWRYGNDPIEVMCAEFPELIPPRFPHAYPTAPLEA